MVYIQPGGFFFIQFARISPEPSLQGVASTSDDLGNAINKPSNMIFSKGAFYIHHPLLTVGYHFKFIAAIFTPIWMVLMALPPVTTVFFFGSQW